MSVQEVEKAITQFSSTDLQRFARWFEEYRSNAGKPETAKRNTTFREIFGPTQAGFDATGLTEDELSDAIESEVSAYRAERRISEQSV